MNACDLSGTIPSADQIDMLLTGGECSRRQPRTHQGLSVAARDPQVRGPYSWNRRGVFKALKEGRRCWSSAGEKRQWDKTRSLDRQLETNFVGLWKRGEVRFCSAVRNTWGFGNSTCSAVRRVDWRGTEWRRGGMKKAIAGVRHADDHGLH